MYSDVGYSAAENEVVKMTNTRWPKVCGTWVGVLAV